MAFKMKGSPMQRNFGVGGSGMGQVSAEQERIASLTASDPLPEGTGQSYTKEVKDKGQFTKDVRDRGKFTKDVTSGEKPTRKTYEEWAKTAPGTAKWVDKEEYESMIKAGKTVGKQAGKYLKSKK